MAMRMESQRRKRRKRSLKSNPKFTKRSDYIT
jgi:hypothetical protein